MDFAEQLKSSIDIVKVAGEYVRLKRVGATGRYVGLCPFHQEKTPSFSVNQTRQFYKCFGCGVGGDAIKFVQEIEGLSFWESAQDAGRALRRSDAQALRLLRRGIEAAGRADGDARHRRAAVSGQSARVRRARRRGRISPSAAFRRK